ncbi:MAG TPA: hypothetical protein VFE55_12605 [Acidimicrobiia bacterium]|nr:hypothetical protein [Acidimicrobiia bacterium]
MNVLDISWADVATKRDLDQLGALLRAEIERATEHTRADLHRTISTHTVAIVFAVIAAVFAVAQIH